MARCMIWIIAARTLDMSFFDSGWSGERAGKTSHRSVSAPARSLRGTPLLRKRFGERGGTRRSFEQLPAPRRVQHYADRDTELRSCSEKFDERSRDGPRQDESRPVYSMFAMLMEMKARGSKGSGTPPGSSGSEDEYSKELSKSARRALAGIRHIKRRMLRHLRSVCEEWERQVRKEFGVVPGQPWTLNDWRKKLSLQRHRGLHRFVATHIAVYEALASGKVEVAKAQACANMKTLAQTALNDGVGGSAG